MRLRSMLPPFCLVACSAAVPSPPASPAGDALAFPRIAAYWIEAYVSPADEATLARAELAVIDAEVSANQPDVLPRLRETRPSLELLVYLTSEEVPHAADPEEAPLAVERFEAITPSEWLVEPGSELVEPVGPDDAVLVVRDGRSFSPTRPASDFYPAGEASYVLVDGEHMRVVSVDGDRIEVERGYRSVATSHEAGAPVAEHVVFFAGTWMLNLASTALASTAPGDPPTWRQRLVDEAASFVEDGPFTGVFLDVCFEDVSFLNDGVLDVDRDGAADDPTAASRAWRQGFGEVVAGLRDRLGTQAAIVGNPGAQNCPHPALDGILLEGWPTGLPEGFLAFDEGLARYFAWSARPRPLTIANGFSPKLGFGVLDEAILERGRTDYAAMRFGLTTALMGDGLFTFDNGVFGHNTAWWYDEYDGAGRGSGWLGAARGPATELPSGVWVRSFDSGMAVANPTAAPVEITLAPGYRKLDGTQDPRHNDGAPARKLSVPARDGYLLSRALSP